MREYVTPEQLLGLLNDALRKYEDCDHCQFTSEITRLRDVQADGLNWSPEVIFGCDGGLHPACETAARDVIEKARERYALKDDAA